MLAVYDYFYPDAIEQYHREEARIQQETHEAKKIFDTCLVQNATDKKNRRGVPCACEETFHEFAGVAGYAAAGEVAETFIKNNPQ